MAIERVNRGAGYWLGFAATVIGGLFIAFIGGVLAWGGIQLIQLEGSWYYVLAGIALVFAGLLMAFRQSFGGLIFGLTLWATLGWAVWEAGLAFWPLLPRVFSPLVIGILAILLLLGVPRAKRRLGMLLTASGVLVAAVIRIEWEPTEELPPSGRGTAGFGSTGR